MTKHLNISVVLLFFFGDVPIYNGSYVRIDIVHIILVQVSPNAKYIVILKIFH